MSDDNLGLDSDDISALTDNAEWVAERADHDYTIYMTISGLDAMDFIDTYHKAQHGDVASIANMFEVVHKFAQVVRDALDCDPNDLEED